MTQQELVDFIVDDLTVSKTLKITLKENEIVRIINAEKKMAYRDWRDACELKIGVINPAVFRTPEFRQSRTIQLPDCVYGIDEFREMKDGSRLFGINSPDLSLERVMGSDLWLSPFSSDVITSRTVSYYWFDLARSFTLVDIQHKFNINTHRINVIGHDPIAPVFIRAFVAIDDADLYDDYYFQRWCIATCKTQIHRLLKTFESTTVGGVNITTLYGEQGKEERESIKEYMKGQDTADWFLEFN